MKHRGFTLAELLIALALLGIIAAFTIPKVLQSSAENERVAKLRETVATLENAWYNAKATNSVSTGTAINTLYDSIQSQLNTVYSSRDIPLNAGQMYSGIANPCAGLAGYVVLANGVVIMNLDNGGYTAAQLNTPGQVPNIFPVCIDVNGIGAPNTLGQDVFIGDFNPWGDFDVNDGAVYTHGDNRKAFHWGSAGETVYFADGTVIDTANFWGDPQARVGTWLTR